jgi:hypothetical protein
MMCYLVKHKGKFTNHVLVTNNMVAEPEGSTQLIPKPAIGHDREIDLCTFRPHDLLPYDLS